MGGKPPSCYCKLIFEGEASCGWGPATTASWEQLRMKTSRASYLSKKSQELGDVCEMA